MRIKALRDLTIVGKPYQVGDIIKVADRIGKIMIDQGKATAANGITPALPVEKTIKESEDRSFKRFKKSRIEEDLGD